MHQTIVNLGSVTPITEPRCAKLLPVVFENYKDFNFRFIHNSLKTDAALSFLNWQFI